MKKLELIEVGRALAAISVVLFHANASVGFVFGDRYVTDLFVWGDRGVDFFFVLSGFIIGHVHGADIGRQDRFRGYVLKRCIRIFPILWFVVVGWMALRFAVNAEAPSPEVASTSLFLIPSLERPEPLVVWTLRHEILFYLLFALLVASRSVGAIIFVLWMGACVVQFFLLLAGGGARGLPAMLLSTFQLQFALGLLAAWLHRKYQPQQPRLLLAGAGLFVGAVIFASVELGAGRTDTLDYVSFGATVWVLAFGTAFACLVFALAACADVVKVPRWFVFLGAASYAIYLVHTPVISVVQRALGVILPEIAVRYGVGQMLLALAGIGAGCVLHVLFERPVTHFLRNKFIARRPAADV